MTSLRHIEMGVCEAAEPSIGTISFHIIANNGVRFREGDVRADIGKSCAEGIR